MVHRHRVLGEWGFDRKLSLGKGVNALFAGPSGTGKTMAAEGVIIATIITAHMTQVRRASGTPQGLHAGHPPGPRAMM